MRTAAELASYKGLVGEMSIDLGAQSRKRRELPPQPITVAVRVVDAREIYGRVDLLIEPVYGNGRAWVNSTRVELRT